MSGDDNDEKQIQKQRPNANYKLSNENVEDEGIVFRYSRERRLEKAPQIVRDLYKPEARYRFSLIRPLVRTRPLAMMFISIIVACVLIVLVSLLGLAGTSYTLDGNHLSIQAIRFEGIIVMAIDKTTRKSGLDRFPLRAPPYTGAVEIAVQPAIQSGEIPQNIFYHKIFFSWEPEEHYRFSIPFDAGELAVVLRSETGTLQLTIKAE